MILLNLTISYRFHQPELCRHFGMIWMISISICAGVNSLDTENGHSTFNQESLWWVSKSYYWVDEHPWLDGNGGSSDPGTNEPCHDAISCLKNWWQIRLLNSTAGDWHSLVTTQAVKSLLLLQKKQEFPEMTSPSSCLEYPVLKKQINCLLIRYLPSSRCSDESTAKKNRKQGWSFMGI